MVGIMTIKLWSQIVALGIAVVSLAICIFYWKFEPIIGMLVAGFFLAGVEVGEKCDD